MPTARACQSAEDFNRFAEGMNMPARCDARLRFAASNLKSAAAVWYEKAGDDELPHRRAFNARSLKAFLPNVIIADSVEENGRRRYRFRLMGTAICELLGDHTGKFLDEAVLPPFRERWFAVLDSANQAGCPLRIFGRLEYREQDYLALEFMVAPLGTRPGHADAVLAIAHASYSARHVFEPLVKDKITSQKAAAV